MAKIGGFSDKNFTEAVKLAQVAQKAADNAADASNAANNKLQTSLDGKITIAQYAPGNDQAAGHNQGDVWYVTNGNGVYTDMYHFDGTSWIRQKWDEETLSVENLSALSSNLGYIQNGTLDSINITAANITGGTISGNSISGNSISGNSISGGNISGSTINSTNINTSEINGTKINKVTANGTFNVDDDNFSVQSGSDYLKFIAGSGSGYTQIHGGLNVDSINVGASVIEGQTFQAYGNSNTHIGSENAWTYLAESIKCGPGSYISSVSGTDIYFHNDAGHTIDIHAGDVISHGTAIKSTLSDKRNISNYSTSEALAKINSTNVVKWQYIENDNDPFEQHIGPIIDNINDIGNKKYYVPNELIISDGKEIAFNQSNAISMLISSVQELSKRNDELSFRITELERNNNK